MSGGFHGIDIEAAWGCVRSARRGLDDLNDSLAIVDELLGEVPDPAFAHTWLTPVRNGIAADAAELATTADTLEHSIDVVVGIDGSWHSPTRLAPTATPAHPAASGAARGAGDTRVLPGSRSPSWPRGGVDPSGLELAPDEVLGLWIVRMGVLLANGLPDGLDFWMEYLNAKVRHEKGFSGVDEMSHRGLTEILESLVGRDDLSGAERMLLFAAVAELGNRMDPDHQRYDQLRALDKLVLQHTGADDDLFMLMFAGMAQLLDHDGRPGEKGYMLDVLARQLAPFVDHMARAGHADWLAGMMNDSYGLMLFFGTTMPKLSADAVAAIGGVLVQRGDLDPANNPGVVRFLHQVASTRPDASLAMLEDPAVRESLLTSSDHDTPLTRDLIVAGLFELREANPHDDDVHARTATVMAAITALADQHDLHSHARRGVALTLPVYLDEWTLAPPRGEQPRIRYTIGSTTIDIPLGEMEMLLGQLAADTGGSPGEPGARDILTSVTGMYYETKMLQAIDDRQSGNPNEFARYQQDVDWHVKGRANMFEQWVVHGHIAYNQRTGTKYKRDAERIDDIYGAAEAPVVATGTAIGSLFGPGGTAVGTAAGKAGYEAGRLLIETFVKGDAPEPLEPGEYVTALDYYKRQGSMEVWVIHRDLGDEVGLSHDAREELAEIVELHRTARTQADWDEYDDRISEWLQRDDVPSEVKTTMDSRWNTG